MKVRGVVLYRGPSELDGKPIVCVATFNSGNSKTGSLIQTWILVDNNQKPTANLNNEDSSICGDCPHRNGSCYVNVGQAPNAVYRSYQNGNYPEYNEQYAYLFQGRVLRLGSYGDPVAVPLEVWKKIVPMTINHTGYTHQWRNKKFEDFRYYCMASIETSADYAQAVLSGWRTFRVKTSKSEKFLGEFNCPASKEMGMKKTCMDCKACQGYNDKKPGMFNVVINAHGLDWKVKRYEKTLEKRGMISLSVV